MWHLLYVWVKLLLPAQKGVWTKQPDQDCLKRRVLVHFKQTLVRFVCVKARRPTTVCFYSRKCDFSMISKAKLIIHLLFVNCSGSSLIDLYKQCLYLCKLFAFGGQFSIILIMLIISYFFMTPEDLNIHIKSIKPLHDLLSVISIWFPHMGPDDALMI